MNDAYVCRAPGLNLSPVIISSRLGSFQTLSLWSLKCDGLINPKVTFTSLVRGSGSEENFSDAYILLCWAGLVGIRGKESSYRNLVWKPEENRPLRIPGFRYKNNIKKGVKVDEWVCIGSVWSQRGLRGWPF